MTRIARASVHVLVILAAALAAACSDNSESKPLEAGRPPVPVSIEQVAASDLEQAVDVVGTLQAKFTADVKSEVTGVVTAVYVTEWVPVKRGDRLAQLDSRETEAGIETLRAAEAQAKVNQNRAQREYERAQQLKEYGLITPQAFDDAKTAVEAADAAMGASRAQIKAAETRLSKLLITSPMDGVVALRGVSVGDRVENMGGNSPMFRIVDNRVLDLTVAVPSSDLASVRVGQTLEFSSETVPGKAFTGKVMFINPMIDPASRSAKVVAEVSNAGGELRDGAFAKGRILVGERSGVLQVRKEALLDWNLETKKAQVFVLDGDTARRREITTGMTSAETVEVLTGLKAGEQVVTRGGFALEDGARVVVSKGEGA
jgi:membrane fusion protein (multidrug efflux system)